MIIKDAYLRALIFESTSDSGVNLIHWSSVVKFGWYKTIPK